MKTRILVAVVCVPLIFVILFVLPPVAVTLFMAAVAVIASDELLRATGSAARKRLYAYAAVPAAIIPAAVYLGSGDPVFRAVLFLLLTVLFTDAVLSYQKENRLRLSQLAAVLFGGTVVPYFLSSVVSLKLAENGQYYALIPFIVAFVTDGGAYFTGVFFGKHKAFPAVSPKKTVEGCVGGIITGVAATVLLGVVMRLGAGLEVSFWALALYGLVGGIVTEFGDLAFSLVKREFGIKDYGRLIPGHGGVLDRFDSMIFAAPAVYMLASVFPAF